MPFTAFPTRSIAGEAFLRGENHELRRAAVDRLSRQDADERAQDAALRSVLSQVNPSAPPDQMYGDIAQRLAGVPGSGKSVLSMITAGQTARTNAAAKADERDWQRERFGLELDQRRQLGEQRMTQQRELAEMKHNLGMQRIAAARSGGGGRGGRRYQDPEDVVMGLLARGKVAEARMVAQAKGVELPPGVMERAERDQGYQQLLKVYEGDAEGFRRASEVYDRTGNFTEAAKAGGPGVSGSGRSGAPAQPPADVRTMEWMVEQGIASDPQDAFTQFRGLRSASNPQTTARQMTDAWARTQLNVTADDYAQQFQRFLGMLQQQAPAGGDPLGLGAEGGEDDPGGDPLGIFSDDEE